MARVGRLGVWTAAFTVLCTAANAYTPEQEQMCSSDAMRLCGAEIPDVDRVTACMVRLRGLLSPGCRQFFRDAAPEATPVIARTPLSLAPRNAKAKAIIRAKKPNRKI